mgnify:CR=1 FL=1
MKFIKSLILGSIFLSFFALNIHSENIVEMNKQVDLFDVGTKKIERGRFVNNLDSNIESYLEQTGWGNKKKKALKTRSEINAFYLVAHRGIEPRTP